MYYKLNPIQRNSEIEDIVKGEGWKYYVWGEVVGCQIIGDYCIIEYVSNHGKDKGKNYFQPFIWETREDWIKFHGDAPYWNDTSTSYHSLESAIVGAIAYKFDGANSQAGSFFGKMVGLKESEE